MTKNARQLLQARRRSAGPTSPGSLEPHRRALKLHCYRMLGSLHEAEDAVQETMLRAWRGFDELRPAPRSRTGSTGSRARVSPSTWWRASFRARPDDAGSSPLGGPSTERPQGAAGRRKRCGWSPILTTPSWRACRIPGAGPDARYELRESVRLAFITAIQQLPPRQRAALLLADVLGWSAIEAAAVLDTSVASVNSALQRARGQAGHARPGCSAGADGRRASADASWTATCGPGKRRPRAFRRPLEGRRHLFDATLARMVSGPRLDRGLLRGRLARLSRAFRLAPVGANLQPGVRPLLPSAPRGAGTPTRCSFCRWTRTGSRR